MTTKAGAQHIIDLKLIYKGVPLIIGRPEDVVERIEAEARADALTVGRYETFTATDGEVSIRRAEDHADGYAEGYRDGLRGFLTVERLAAALWKEGETLERWLRDANGDSTTCAAAILAALEADR